MSREVGRVKLTNILLMLTNFSAFIKKYRNYIFVILILFLAARVILPQLDDLQQSIEALKGADLWWIALGLIAYFLGMPILSEQFVCIAIKPIKFLMTLRVQLAGLFVGKLLPNGVGSITLNIYYLIKQNHTATQASSVMAMNAILSAVAYIFLILYALIKSSVSFEGINGNINIPFNLIIFIIILAFGIVFWALHSTSIRNRIKSVLSDLKSSLASYKKRPKSLAIGIICNGVGSLTSIIALFASAKAVGVNLTFAESLFAYTLGNVVATLVPTPGGIGAAEAGIYSALVLIGIEGPDAVIITLLFRLVTYWLPIIPGYYFFWGLRKNLLANFSFKKHY